MTESARKDWREFRITPVLVTRGFDGSERIPIPKSSIPPDFMLHAFLRVGSFPNAQPTNLIHFSMCERSRTPLARNAPPPFRRVCRAWERSHGLLQTKHAWAFSGFLARKQFSLGGWYAFTAATSQVHAGLRSADCCQ